MAETMPTMDPAELIQAQADALTAKLVRVAGDAVKAALEQGAPASVADVMTSLEEVAQTLPAGLLAEIESALPEIARQAVIAAEVEIADARAESGKPFPSITPPPTGDYAGWAVTAVGALVASLRKRVDDADVSKIMSDLDKEAEAALSPIADTSAARAVNESRMEVFRANADVVQKVKVVTVADAKRSEVCTNMNGATFDPKRPVPTPPFHAHCRSYLKAITGVKRKAGATEKEIARQNWAIFRRMEREAKAEAEGRSAPIEFRFAAEGEGAIAGYACVFSELDSHNTAFAPGAFRQSVVEQRAAGHVIPMLWGHDQTQVVGTWTAIEEDGRGLRVRGQLVTETTAGAEAYRLLRAGSLNGLSVGFRRLADQPRHGGGRLITRAHLAEISLVAVPSNSNARVDEIRAHPAARAASTEDKKMPLDNAPADSGKDLDSRVGALETTVTEIKSAVDEIKAAVTKTEARADRLEARSARLGLGGGDKPSNDLEKRAFVAYLRGGREALGAEETRALRLSDDEAAGYLAPPEFVAEIDKDLAQFSPIRQLATVRNTSRSEVNTLRRTSPATATWVGEDDDRDETEVRYGQQSFPVRELATFVDVSLSLLEDAAVDVSAELSAEFAEAFGLAEGQAFVNGNGVLRPLGFMSDTSLSFTNSGHASLITADSLIDLFHAQKPAYRQNGTWLMNSQTLAACRKLKDSQGRYLVDIGGMAGAPSTTILGRPVQEDPNMPDIGAGAFPIAFGDFRVGMRIFDRIALSIVRDDFTQRTKGRVRFHGRRRVAAGVRRAEAIRKLRISAS